MINTDHLSPDAEALAAELRRCDDYRVLRRVPKPYPSMPHMGPVPDGRCVAIVDVETTGLSAENDVIIELAIMLTKSVHAPAHWAPPKTELAADRPPAPSAPSAGGDVKEPPSAADWEWQLCTVISASEVPPGPGKPGENCVHRGGCHCGSVRFEVDAPASLVVWECNCTDCRMRRNLHFVVPKKALRLVEHGAHHLDLFFSNPADPPSVQAVRAALLAFTPSPQDYITQLG